ncbi:unnamed protein product [Lymnaea stagnalis]|uniref:Apple domain-containing protein n=1 Tax=Lymnaea stagnalis TaxID=6523 RepID=A0AAV2H0S3_LYMST
MFENRWCISIMAVVLVVSLPVSSAQTVSQSTSGFCNGSTCVSQTPATTTGSQNTAEPTLIAHVYGVKYISGSSNTMAPMALAILYGVITNPDCAFRCNQNDLCVSFRVYTGNKACVLYKAGLEATGLSMFNKKT